MKSENEISWEAHTATILPGSIIEFFDKNTNSKIQVRVVSPFEIATPITKKINVEHIKTIGEKNG